MYHEGKVDLPYADRESRRKVDQLLRQMVGFTTDKKTTTRNGPSDILMASWFPFASVIRRWRSENRHSQVRIAETSSFPDYVKTSVEVPWGTTNYLNSG